MDEKFKFYLPADLIKSGTDSSGQEVMKIKGIASTSDKDSQGEFLDPSGFDLTSFRWLNWNHKGKDDPATIIGEPTLATITPNNELYIEGVLYPELPMAKATFSLMKALNNSPNGNKLSLSVEGKVIQRASNDKKSPLYNRILKSKITAVALCPIPINGNTWTDLITKGVTGEDKKEDVEEEYDEDTKKAIMAAGSTITKEDVEGVIKKPALRKSDIYDRIFTQYPSLDIEKAKSVYLLIEKIATMENEAKTVSDETIKKSFEILNLASEEISKATKPEEVITKAADDTDDEEEDKEMYEKSVKAAKEFKKGGMDKEAIKAKLLKKGYGDKMVSKAIAKAEEEEDEEKEVKKSEPETLAPSVDFEALIKSQTASLDKKFQALGTILKSQSDENAELKKSLEIALEANADLKKDIEKAFAQPVGRKSVITKSFSEKFEKSSDGKYTYNISSAQDRKALQAKILDLSGINKGDGNFDQSLAKMAQDIELVKGLTPQALHRLEALDIRVMTNQA